MDTKLLHIFRNTAFGRETLLQSISFCKKTDTALVVYIPKFTKFLMYVQVDLDESYIKAPDSALEHVTEIVEQCSIKPSFYVPKDFTASTLPDISTNFDFMCCPRSISDLSSKVGLGYIGPRVRRIINSARFPILITSPIYKEWNSIMVFFGGSLNAVNALKLGFRLCRVTGMQLDVFTQIEKGYSESSYKKVISDCNLEEAMEKYVTKWHVFNKGKFDENLYNVPHDAFVIVGAFGHGIIKDMIFGSKMEKIQSTISNNLLIVGPRYKATA